MKDQQKFWKEKYADSYREKNDDFNLELGAEAWRKILFNTSDIDNLLECGSNIGRNIGILETVLPHAKKSIIEINKTSYDLAKTRYSIDHSFNGSILESDFKINSFDLVFTSGVLIHIHPDDVLENMKKLYSYSKKYIVIAEYFNRTPVMIPYQGEDDKLFKQDFGKLFIENFNVSLLDYGFLWGHVYDEAGFDDFTWWLFEK